MTITHQGHDQAGAPTAHKGLLENCPTPACQDRVTEQTEAWGVYCPHGQRIVEADPDAGTDDVAGQSVGRIVELWPCTVDSCTREAFEQHEAEREDEYWASLLAEGWGR